MRNVLNMDFDWSFHRGEPETKAAVTHAESYLAVKAGACGGGADVNCPTDGWETVDLPHDYLTSSRIGENELRSHGYRERSNAWYRKTFVLDASYRDRQLLICFEGTAVNAEFFFNGSLLGRSFSAYTETVLDVTDRAYFDGRPNVLAVHIDGQSSEGWWYEGAGLYRHVKLYDKPLLHLAHHGVFACPKHKEGTKNTFLTDMDVTLENSGYEDGTVRVRTEILDGTAVVAEAVTAPVTVKANEKAAVRQALTVNDPRRWDVDDPYRYTCRVTVLDGEEPTDSEEFKIGFRTFRVSAKEGFFLNERPLKIKGTCNHQDHAGVGVAVPDAVQYYRVQRLKEMGTNAYRCSHNPPAPEILDACDELGMIVMDENRRFETREEILSDLRTLIKRDRNHPSVVFWSLFNEEPIQNSEEGARIFRRMKAEVKKLDDSRLITGAINGTFEGAGLEGDIVGMNYNLRNIPSMHEKHPDKPVIGSENNSAVTTRGCYQTDRDAHVLANYDEETVPWGQTIRESWDFVRKNPWFSGLFVWTGFDYRGEPTPFLYPSVSSQFGIMDTCGFAKDAFYYHQACFTEKPMIHLLPHWTHKPGDTVRVVAVTNAPEAELILNGRSLGKKPADVCAPPEWSVPFEPGTLCARAYRDGALVAEDIAVTAHGAKALVIEPVRPFVFDDGQDAMILNVRATDENGTTVPDCMAHVTFTLDGDAVFLGAGNGDPNSHEIDALPERDLYHGLAQAIVRAKKEAKAITVTVEADGLLPASFSPEVRHRAPAPYLPTAHACYATGVTVSQTFVDRPDPLMTVGDYDMNSFYPVVITDNYPPEYKNGWRIYRMKLVLPEPLIKKDDQGRYALEFGCTCLSGLEIYVDGQEIFRDIKPFGFTVPNTRHPFTGTPGKAVEFRILTYMDKDNTAGPGGIKDYIRLSDDLPEE